MPRRRNVLLGSALAVPVTALAIAGCGSSGNTVKASSPATGSAASMANGPATVAAHNSNLGTILVDSRGRTLYLFEKDTSPKSMCSGACASAWPPLRTTGKPKAGSGVTASMLGTTTRSDGKPEVTYNGHPLYYYAGDTKAGDTNGQDLKQFGASWYVLSPAGNKVEADGSSTTGGGGSGY